MPGRLGTFMNLIRFEHTLFALPYAVAGALLAARGLPEGRTFLWIIVAMVGARTAAMTFNRLVDRRIDRANPRTANRASASGEISVGFLVGATVVAAGLFFFAAFMLNRLAFMLAGPTLVVLLGYSLTKRFTRWSHFVLGAALGLSPLGAWVAVQADLSTAWPAFYLGLAVLFWTAGFDILYACQDENFDRDAGLFSVPARLGRRGAFLVARLAHVAVPLLLFAVGQTASLGVVYHVAVVLVAALLIYEHSIVGVDDLDRLGRAFFTVNIVISVVVMSATFLDLILISGAAA